MPAKTRKQQRFAAMSATPEGRKALKASGKEPMPVDVAKEFRHKPKRSRSGK
jgi:hypothetical protein